MCLFNDGPVSISVNHNKVVLTLVVEEVSRYAPEGICWQDRREGWGIRLGGCHMVAVMTVCVVVIAGVVEIVFKLIVKVPVVGNIADTPNPPGLLPV